MTQWFQGADLSACTLGRVAPFCFLSKREIIFCLGTDSNGMSFFESGFRPQRQTRLNKCLWGGGTEGPRVRRRRPPSPREELLGDQPCTPGRGGGQIKRGTCRQRSVTPSPLQELDKLLN